MFRLELVTDGLYDIYFEGNNKTIGHTRKLEDGYYHIHLDSAGGYWSDHTLIEIGTLIKELNKPYDDHVNEYFKKQKELDERTTI